jgi:hypothetical protein
MHFDTEKGESIVKMEVEKIYKARATYILVLVQH